jgi:group I intron endonuclease
MLIWSTYFQKSMTALCNNVLGTNTICGIYKITNQNNDMCYIGQSVDISTRWKNHAKCGLGIDTPAGNKLYKAMQEEGIWNFSWELLEKCPREELNKKENYYIELYKTYEYGYNSNIGVKK